MSYHSLIILQHGQTHAIFKSTMSNSSLLKAYSAPPWIYDIRGFFILTFAYRSTLWPQLRLFGSNMGMRHLEIAVGTGTLLYLILKWRRQRDMTEAEIIAIDYVPSMLEGGRKYFRNNPHVKLAVGDATKLDFPNDTFDTVNIANSMHCFSEIDAAIEETFRVLKPGGTLASNVLLYPKGVWPLKQIARLINDWGTRKGILKTPYLEQDIRGRIVSVGFRIISEKVSGNCYYILVRKPTL
jgi:ubiquinone/menaquinone biosynthesis C-methylase UbiE